MPISTPHHSPEDLAAIVHEIFPYADNFGQLVGYTAQMVKAGEVLVSLKIEDKHLSPSGAAHGGVISTFVDFAMGAALFTVLPKGKKCSTIEFKINYFSPVRSGETIFARGKIKFSGKSHAVIESHVFREHEKKKDIAMALGTYNIY